MAVKMSTQFSEDGKYFAQIATDGKIKVWNTQSNSFEQEFTPDYHLTTPCTCLHFLKSESSNKSVSPRKKKRRESESASSPTLVLGTNSGLLLVYSLAKADLECTINSETSQSVSCLSAADSNLVYSGVDQNVFVWNINKRIVSSKWKVGNEKVTSILVVPDSNTVLTASKNIKLWHIQKQEVLQTYTGHSSDVTFLQYVHPRENADSYFLSGSKGDRLLSCWNLGSNSSTNKNAVASFLMEDVVQNVSINVAADGSTSMAACVRSGVVHIYQHTLNGKCGKPVKPKTTIQVVSDTGQSKELVTPIRIVGALHRDNETICIGHGTDIVLTFENVSISTFKKILCLVRNDPRRVSSSTQENNISKIKTPIVSNDVMYLTPQTSGGTAAKRKNDGKQEVPMEQRLENLTLNKIEGSIVPKADNLAQLLVQGLHSKDKNLLRDVLCKKDENIIRNTVRRLPLTVVTPLVEELNNFLQGKTLSCQIGSLWLRHILQIHASILISNPSLTQYLGNALGGIESRLSLQMPLSRLRGRLDLLVSQISSSGSDDNSESEKPLLVFNDKDSSESENEEMELDGHSESDNEWEEESEIDDIENNAENNDGGSDENSEDSDEEMST